MTGPHLDLDPQLASFARDANLAWQVEPDGRLVVGESEVTLHVSREGEDVVIDRVSRGNPAGRQLRTRELAAVERYLVAWIGEAWRENRGLPRAVVDATTTAPDATVVAEESWIVTLRWSQDGRPCVAEELNRGSAHRVAGLLAHNLSTVIASYQDPAGRPALVLV